MTTDADQNLIATLKTWHPVRNRSDSAVQLMQQAAEAIARLSDRIDELQTIQKK
jgi:hypothetical protein